MCAGKTVAHTRFSSHVSLFDLWPQDEWKNKTRINSSWQHTRFVLFFFCRIGRRWPTCVFLLICAVANIAVVFTPDTTGAVIGSFAMSQAHWLVWSFLMLKLSSLVHTSSMTPKFDYVNPRVIELCRSSFIFKNNTNEWLITYVCFGKCTNEFYLFCLLLLTCLFCDFLSVLYKNKTKINKIK